MRLITKIKAHRIVILEIVLFLLIAYLFNIVNYSNRKDKWEFIGRDINVEFDQALVLAGGGNPYAKILQFNLLSNNKYATLFPLYYYYLSAVAGSVGNNFEEFLTVYRQELYYAEFATALVIYLIFRRSNKKVLGYLACTFFLFNRWTISIIQDAKQDVIAMLFLMIALYMLSSATKKVKLLSFLFLGLSIGIKHIGIFVAPVFLLPFINKELTLKDMVKAGLLFLLPTIGVGLPVIINNPLAFFYSMLFSFTREPMNKLTEFGYEKLLVLYDIGVKNNNIFFYMLPRLPLVIFTALNFWALVSKKTSLYLYCFTGLFIFIAFNPVQFPQYFAWVTPFVFLTGYEVFARKDLMEKR